MHPWGEGVREAVAGRPLNDGGCSETTATDAGPLVVPHGVGRGLQDVACDSPLPVNVPFPLV